MSAYDADRAILGVKRIHDFWWELWASWLDPDGRLEAAHLIGTYATKEGAEDQVDKMRGSTERTLQDVGAARIEKAVGLHVVAQHMLFEFWSPGGKKIARMWWDKENLLHFEGVMTEAARDFFNMVVPLVDSYVQSKLRERKDQP